MYKRFAPLVVMLLLMSLVLVACGNSADDNPPSYSNAKSVTLPDDLKKQFTQSAGSGVKDAKIDTYSTSDDATKVKTFFLDEFKKKGWADQSSTISGFGDSVKQIETAGGFGFFYTKGDKAAAAVIAFPGLVAKALNIQNVNDNELVYIVISGKK